MTTDVLLLGSGAREHALAWKLRQSPQVGELYIGPGNPGTSEVGSNICVDLADFDSITQFARTHRVGLVVIGPEGPLAAGIADELAGAGVPVYGPSQSAARIESSKSFAKELMHDVCIPTAQFSVFADYDDAAAFVRAMPSAPVIKADGLAAGKGVTVASDHHQAVDALRTAMVDEAFGEAGRRVVVEERLYGREVSAHAFCDGTRALPMPYACDHKSVFDGGLGPNTGGMGAYSPPSFVDAALDREIRSGIFEAVLAELSRQGSPYRGTLYPGLMITSNGPRVVEFNCRFGDPETQVILPRLASDLFEPLWRCANGDLGDLRPVWSENACVGVVLAASGYPGTYRQGDEISGLDELDADVLVFHAGTATNPNGALVTAGGRVLTVVAAGPTLAEARLRAYANVERIRFAGKHFRQDIGLTEERSA